MYEKVALYVNRKIQNSRELEEEFRSLIAGFGKKVTPLDEGTELLITLGGDGTVLKGFRMLKNPDTHLVGMNFGKFGFLTIECRDKKDILKIVFSGKFAVTHRTFLETYLKNGKTETPSGSALNEVIVFRKDIRILAVDLALREGSFPLRADGIIVSTATGSTAHSFAAGGPILPPEDRSLAIVAEAPFTPIWRNFIYGGEELVIGVDQESDVVLDGQEKYALTPPQKLRIRKAKNRFKLLVPENWNFWETVREKFRWGKSVS